MQTTVLLLLSTKRVVILAMMKTTMTKMWTAMKKEEDGNMQWRKRTQLAARAFAPFSQKTRQWMLCMCVPASIHLLHPNNQPFQMNECFRHHLRQSRTQEICRRHFSPLLRFLKIFHCVFRVFKVKNGILKITKIIFTQNMWFLGTFKLSSCSRCLVMGK